MKNKIKTLNLVKSFDRSRGTIREIIEFNGKKFRITAELANGSNTLEAYIMDSDGVFHFALGKFDVDFKYTASYVSDDRRKQDDLEDAIAEIEKVIMAVYG